MLTVALLAGSGAALAATAGSGPVDAAGVVHGCFSNREHRGSHGLVLQDTNRPCPGGSTAVSWNQTGPASPQGPTGGPGYCRCARSGGCARPRRPRRPTGTGRSRLHRHRQQHPEGAAGQGATCTIGQITLSASTSVTNGVPADGQVLPISGYTELFALLGNTYGGDGLRTFALPNLTNLAPNNMTYSICISGVFPARG